MTIKFWILLIYVVIYCQNLAVKNRSITYTKTFMNETPDLIFIILSFQLRDCWRLTLNLGPLISKMTARLGLFNKTLRIRKLLICSYRQILTVNLLVNWKHSVIYGHFAVNYEEKSFMAQAATTALAVLLSLFKAIFYT